MKGQAGVIALALALAFGQPAGATEGAEASALRSCLPPIIKPFSETSFRDWPGMLAKCQTLKDAAKPLVRLHANLMAARLNYIQGNFDASLADLAAAEALLADMPALSTGVVRQEVAVLGILHQLRAGEAEQALVRARALSDEHPLFLAAHRIYEDTALEQDQFEDMVIALQRQYRLNPSRAIRQKIVFMERKLQRYDQARALILNEIDATRAAYNIHELLLDLVEAEYSLGNLDVTEQILGGIPERRLANANHPWQKTVFADYPSLATKKFGAAFSRSDRAKLRRLKGMSKLASGETDAAVALMEGVDLNCKYKECMLFEAALEEARGNTEEAAAIRSKVERTQFGVTRVSRRKWDRNLLIYLASTPVEMLIYDTDPDFSFNARQQSNGEVRIQVESKQAQDFETMRQQSFLQAMDYAKEVGADGFVVLSSQQSYQSRKSQIEGFDHKQFVSQRSVLKVLMVGGETGFDTSVLVPWRVIAAN